LLVTKLTTTTMKDKKRRRIKPPLCKVINMEGKR